MQRITLAYPRNIRQLENATKLYLISYFIRAGKSTSTILHKPIDRRRTLFLRFPKIESPPNKKYNVFETNVKKTHTKAKTNQPKEHIHAEKNKSHNDYDMQCE